MRRRRAALLVVVLAGAVVLSVSGLTARAPALIVPAAQAVAEPPAAVKTAIRQAGPIDPVSGKKVKAEDAPIAIFLDRVYKFASAANLEKFRAAPEKYASTTCPVTDDPIVIKNAPAKTVYGGRTWYFCGEECKAKFDAEPASYATYRCPSCGGIAPISMAGPVTGTYDGRGMRSCCEHCKEKFDADPEAYFRLVVPEGGVPQTENEAGKKE
jgi:YHS domain-containing protein